MARIITDYLDYAAEHNPNKIALVDEKRKVTYAQYREGALQICCAIMEYGAKKSPIVIFMDKGIDSILAMFAVAYSGNYYIVLNTDSPRDKNAELIRFIEPMLVLTTSSLIEKLPDVNRNIIIVDEISLAIDHKQVYKNIESVIGSDPLQVVFTSGSTGKPKGVITSHKSAIAYAEAGVKAYDLNESDIYGNIYNFHSISVIADLFFSLKTMATVFVFPDKIVFEPFRFINDMVQNRVTILQCAPSVLMLFHQFGCLEKTKPYDLKKIIFGGEPLPVNTLSELQKLLPNVTFINAYGATEVTDACTFYVVNNKVSSLEQVPIGKALNNCEIILLDENNSISSSGEICVRGESLAIGYYRDNSETSKKFVNYLINDCYVEKIYRTGDYGKYDDNGDLIFCGRVDNQVEVNGNRIELEEIEHEIRKLVGKVDTCYCVFSGGIILAYRGDMSRKEIEKQLRKKIENYKIPGKYVRVSSFPINSNGKIDRKELTKYCEREIQKGNFE